MRPVIGITSDIEPQKFYVKQPYVTSIIESGGLPYILPQTQDLTIIQDLLGHINGLLLTGGSDIDPSLYGEEPQPGLGQIKPDRDQFEKLLIQEALKRNMPIFAICRGSHMLNAASGGSLLQDIQSRNNAALQHYQMAPRDYCSHFVTINKGTLLHQIIQANQIKVNTFHHQAINKPAPGFQISAASSDGIIEGIESTLYRFVLGVQWHPGDLIHKESHAKRLFQSFIDACLNK
ncbi:putative glutamine amidotransferase [Scopulibacillus daqui]|uniref:Glutamine amidotransferase n=1 Tax=Scopulibacillus daqui TaxID=1469162 RepID=A0ABS2PZ43_9BACL|nr:gamma-glutamyl-gamma-aminobutyrate hydrolase family protein [Scopulibacillus daqui]MBM7645141.1 putative glutamine amidotransferase [Scopulibacillus daqui]